MGLFYSPIWAGALSGPQAEEPSPEQSQEPEQSVESSEEGLGENAEENAEENPEENPEKPPPPAEDKSGQEAPPEEPKPLREPPLLVEVKDPPSTLEQEAPDGSPEVEEGVSSAQVGGEVAAAAASSDGSETSAEAEGKKSKVFGPGGCRKVENAEDWVEKMRYGVYVGVCASARWLDGFFGAENTEYEKDSTYGRVGGSVSYDGRDSFKFRGRLRARFELPRFEHRWNAFFGRYDEDDFVSGRGEDLGRGIPRVFRQDLTEDWLAGLGYSPVRSGRSRFDLDAGVKVGFPMDPFVSARYRYFLFLGEVSLVRYRHTIFWRREKGYGSTSRVDIERVLGEKTHLRWRSTATWAENTDGLEWDSATTLYRYLGERRALALEIESDGETDGVPLDQYGLRAIYRQEWRWKGFFYEVEGRVFWPDTPDGTSRETTYGLGIGFELLFGDHPWMNR